MVFLPAGSPISAEDYKSSVRRAVISWPLHSTKLMILCQSIFFLYFLSLFFCQIGWEHSFHGGTQVWKEFHTMVLVYCRCPQSFTSTHFSLCAETQCELCPTNTRHGMGLQKRHQFYVFKKPAAVKSESFVGWLSWSIVYMHSKKSNKSAENKELKTLCWTQSTPLSTPHLAPSRLQWRLHLTSDARGHKVFPQGEHIQLHKGCNKIKHRTVIPIHVVTKIVISWKWSGTESEKNFYGMH